MSRSPSPVGISPLTREVQFDEKWSFVAKKEKNRDPDDPVEDRKGDAWDHVAIDAESRLVPCVAPGKRTAENVVAVVEDVKRRTGGAITGFDHHRRLSRLRGGHPERLRGDDHPTAIRQAGTPLGPLQDRAGGLDLRRGGEDPRRAGWSRSPPGWSSARWAP